MKKYATYVKEALIGWLLAAIFGCGVEQFCDFRETRNVLTHMILKTSHKLRCKLYFENSKFCTLIPAARMGRSGGARKQGSAPGISGAGLKMHITINDFFERTRSNVHTL